MRSVIICVDDDRFVLSSLSDQLNEWFGKNYTIEKALSGEEGLLIIDEYKERNTNISVVISDYIMPVMRGDQFLEEVHKKDSSIKKIMLTGYSALDGVINAINKAELYRFVSKPWDSKDLLLTIMEAVKSYEQQQNMSRVSTNFKTLYNQYSTMINDMRLCYDSTLTALIGAVEKRLGNAASINMVNGLKHSLGVKYYCTELAKALKMSKEEQYIAGCLGLLHEVGKLNFSDEQLIELEQTRGCIDYSSPIIQELYKQTLALTSSISNNNFISILDHQYSMYKPDLPTHSRILAIADAFESIVSTAVSNAEAYKLLSKYAQDGFLDSNMVKIFIENVPIYK